MAQADRSEPAFSKDQEKSLWKILGRDDYHAALPRLEAIVRTHPQAHLIAVKAYSEAYLTEQLRVLPTEVTLLGGIANAARLEADALSIQVWLESLDPNLASCHGRQTLSALADTWTTPYSAEFNATFSRLYADARRLAELAHACGVLLRQGARRKPGPRRSQPELIPYLVGDALEKVGIPLSRGPAGKWVKVVGIVYKAARQTPPKDIKREVIRAYRLLKGTPERVGVRRNA